MDRLRVFCWCGKSQREIPAAVIMRVETWECDTACRRRYETKGVNFDTAGRPAQGVNGHPVNCGCCPECVENRRQYNRARAAKAAS